jgi:hypothetical protein
MKRRHVLVRGLVCCAVTLPVIALAPVVVFIGEPLRRYYLRRPRQAGWRQGLASQVCANPVLIALTAPGRWIIDRFTSPGRGGSGFGRLGGLGRRGGTSPPPAGVREPRRPKPTAPAGAVALAEPRQYQVVRILKALPVALSGPVRRLGPRLASVLKVLASRWPPRRAG